MEEGKRYYRLGLFVVSAIAVLGVLLFVLGGRRFFQPTYTFETYLDQSVAGLQPGSQLQFRGVPLGQVSEILTSGATYERDVPLSQRRNYIVVRARVNVSADEVSQIRQEAQHMVARGLRAQTQLAGISGQQYLALDYFDPASSPPLKFNWTPRYTYVPSAPSRSAEITAKLQVFLANLSDVDLKDISKNADRLLTNLNNQLRDLPLGEIFASTQVVLKNANSALMHADRMMADPDLKRSVDNVNALTGNLRGLADHGDLTRALARTNEALERLNGMLTDNQYDARVIVRDLRATTENLRELSTTVRRNPAGALIGGPPERVRLPDENSQ
jgi:phospholipid/cholesterol/gamma-HCH transport system substrate-binding protein